jgi:predicted RNA methylase
MLSGSPRPRRKARGQFFTPDDIALRLLRRAAEDLQAAGETVPTHGLVLDPACGDGAFLRAAVSTGWASPETLRGVDSDASVLSGPPGADLRTGDGLVAEGTFDAVVGNPPFGGRGVRDRSTAELAALGRSFSIHRVDSRGRLRSGDVGVRPKFPIATLFVERFVRSARPGAVVGLVLPASFLANRRDAGPRAWLLRRVRLVAIDELGDGTFAATGTRANTVFLLGVRRPAVLESLDVAALDRPVRLGRVDGDRFFAVVSKLLTGRWDPRYHDPTWDSVLVGCRRPLKPLGEFIVEITYGAIKPGAAPRPASTGDPTAFYVTQRAVTDAGVNLRACPRIVAERPWDTTRARLTPGDLVVPRSGVGTLGRNRLTRFDGAPLPAVVDCFTDRVVLRGISSAWVLGFLRSERGWSQIRRTFNGVGTPNLSFGEIRSLQVPVPTQAQSTSAEELWTRIAAEDLPFDALRAYVTLES